MSSLAFSVASSTFLFSWSRFFKVFSVLLFQGVLYFPVKTKERVTLEANRNAPGLMDFALESALFRLGENPPRGHSVKEEAQAKAN